MPAKPASRSWNDVQTAIAAVAVVTTLGLWNVFATPAKTAAAKTDEPVIPPTEPPATQAPVVMPQVKIMFTPQVTPQQNTVVQQPQNNNKKKKKNNNNNNNSGSGSVTQTTSS
jgi:hypothetical protein